MTGSVAIDVVIGLVFVYLLYSLLATILQEIVATNLSFRAKILEHAIIRMLNDGPSESDQRYIRARFAGLWRLLIRKSDALTGLAQEFYQTPLIKYLGQDQWHSKPSYLTSKNFSKVLVDLLRGDDPKAGENFGEKIEAGLKDKHATAIKLKENNLSGLLSSIDKSLKPDKLNKKVEKELQAVIRSLTQEATIGRGDTYSFLKSLWADAHGDVEKFKTHLEQWFDDTMERASGWYKQYTQVILFGIGLFIAVGFNVDTLQIVDKLSNDPELRAQVVSQADAYMKEHPDLKAKVESLKKDFPTDTLLIQDAEKTLTQFEKRKDSLRQIASALVKKDIANINSLLALGWNFQFDVEICSWAVYTKFALSPKGKPFDGSQIIGWLLTAIAISLGAPFWFDLLNKLMKLRGSIATQASSADGKATTLVTDKGKTIIPKG